MRKKSNIVVCLLMLVVSCRERHDSQADENFEAANHLAFSSVTLTPEYDIEVSDNGLLKARRDVLSKAGFLPRFIKFFQVLEPEGGVAEMAVSVIVERSKWEGDSWRISTEGKEIRGKRSDKGEKIFSVKGVDFFYGEIVFLVSTEISANFESTLEIRSGGETMPAVKISELKVLSKIAKMKEEAVKEKKIVFEVHIPLREQKIEVNIPTKD